MSYLDDLLAEINGARGQLTQLTTTGGAPAQTTTTQQASTQKAKPDPLAALAAIVGRGRAQGVADALKGSGQSMDNRTSRAAQAAAQFGGQVLGYGSHPKVGQMGDFATVLRGGKLWHIYGDGDKMKLSEGQVAQALGIKPKVAQIVGAGGDTGSRYSMAGPVGKVAPGDDPTRPYRGLRGASYDTGGAEAPSDPGGTGGAFAPDSAAPAQAGGLYHDGGDPLSELRRLLASHA